MVLSMAKEYTWGKGQWEGDRYVGQWRNGKQHGQGTYTWGKGRQWEGDRYVGQWRNEPGKVKEHIFIQMEINT